MSDITILEKFSINGTYIDPTSVKLSDPTGTFGVIRRDTDAIVGGAVAGTVMTQVSTGQYSFTFTEPEAGLSYEYWVEWVYNGETYRDQHFKDGSASIPTTVTGSTIVLDEKFKIGDTYIDPTYVKLSDPTGAFGVRRTDTGEIVVADAVSMTKSSTGQYTYTFTEPEASLTYEYWVEWVYDGETYRDQHFKVGFAESTGLETERVTDKYLDWVKNEFKPLTIVTPDATLEQCLENAIRYWNTHSGFKITAMFDYDGSKRIQLNTQFKSVVHVLPCQRTNWVLNDHPLWSLLGVSVLNNVTSDLITVTEAFKNYQIYVGSDMRWTYEKSDDPSVGGYLYLSCVPTDVTRLAVVGTKRITSTEDIVDEYILNWVLYYFKALVKQVEGNTLRKSSVIGIKNDGQELYGEGKEEMKELQTQLKTDGRWVMFGFRG